MQPRKSSYTRALPQPIEVPEMLRRYPFPLFVRGGSNLAYRFFNGLLTRTACPRSVGRREKSEVVFWPILNTAVAWTSLCLATTVVAQQPYKHAVKIGELAQALVQPGVVQGVSIGVVDHDRTWTHSYGTLAESVPTTPNENTIYEIGSISKVFTGVLLAHAVGEGEVTLGTSIGEIETSLLHSNPTLASGIQLRHLSTHASGLPRMPDNWKPANTHQPYEDYDRELMMQYLATAKPTSEPGKPSGYSNFAVGLLGELLATKAGTTYESLLKQRIVDPLAMTSTSVRVSAENRPRVAPPHQASGAADHEWAFDAFAGAGAIHGTTSDMLRFIDAHLHPLESPAQQPLARAIELAWQQHLPAADGGFAMGLGWHIARDGETRWHNGQTGGYHSMMLISRRLECGVIVLSNSASAEIDALGESIIQLLAGAKVEPTKIPDVQLESEGVARLAGDYVLAPGFIMTVTTKAERLFVQLTGQPQLRVYPTSLTEWSYREVAAKLSFELPEQGSATSVTLHQNGRVIKATRQ